MRTVNIHEAKTHFSGLLAEIEQHGSHIVICRHGVPVADLVPHQPQLSMKADPKLGALSIGCDPIAPLTEDEWPPAL